MDDTFVKKSDMDGRPIYISLNHVMEYYVYACYFEPETDVLCTELPVGEYYRTYGSLCLKLSKFRRAEDAFKKAICIVCLIIYIAICVAHSCRLSIIPCNIIKSHISVISCHRCAAAAESVCLLCNIKISRQHIKILITFCKSVLHI